MTLLQAYRAHGTYLGPNYCSTIGLNTKVVVGLEILIWFAIELINKTEIEKPIHVSCLFTRKHQYRCLHRIETFFKDGCVHN